MNPFSSASQLFAIDWSQVSPAVCEALFSGKAGIINGVARARTDGYKILQHMPFRPVSIDGLNDLSSAARGVQNFPAVLSGIAPASLQCAMALSTAVTVGTVVLCTAYLAEKLRELDGKIDRLHAEIRNQNLIYYAARASAYFGAVEAVREIIAQPLLVEENPDLVTQAISRLAGQRHETLAFLNHQYRTFHQLTPEHLEVGMDFFHATLDFLPKAVFVESQAAYKLDRFQLGDQIRRSGRIGYQSCADSYRAWGNSELRKTISGVGSHSGRLLGERLTDAKRILNSEENKLLLDHSI
ncbi:MAG: hypothetical protein K9N23_04940 [Akkermansiaceae bacterium]|nr:hypothetical protein [Akkermansiaceae bacterium]MCF7731007.1 hypothetical protein [Akkermansiaceae bacterium]